MSWVIIRIAVWSYAAGRTCFWHKMAPFGAIYYSFGAELRSFGAKYVFYNKKIIKANYA